MRLKNQNILFWLLPHPASLPSTARRQVSTISNGRLFYIMMCGARVTKEIRTEMNKGGGCKGTAVKRDVPKSCFSNSTWFSEWETTVLSSVLSWNYAGRCAFILSNGIDSTGGKVKYANSYDENSISNENCKQGTQTNGTLVNCKGFLWVSLDYFYWNSSSCRKGDLWTI